MSGTDLFALVMAGIAFAGLLFLHIARSPKDSHNELTARVDLLYQKHSELAVAVASHQPLMMERTQAFDRSLQSLTTAVNSLREAIQEEFSELRHEIHDLRSKSIGRG